MYSSSCLQILSMIIAAAMITKCLECCLDSYRLFSRTPQQISVKIFCSFFVTFVALLPLSSYFTRDCSVLIRKVDLNALLGPWSTRIDKIILIFSFWNWDVPQTFQMRLDRNDNSPFPALLSVRLSLGCLFWRKKISSLDLHLSICTMWTSVDAEDFPGTCLSCGDLFLYLFNGRLSSACRVMSAWMSSGSTPTSFKNTKHGLRTPQSCAL